MKICTLWIDGYGRFADRTVELAPGLQVILGPNEQGKTTVRCFIGDMLYGQRRANAEVGYDESHDLRRPWADPADYVGRIRYRLDNGREFEVHRDFNEGDAGVRVFDGESGDEVTDQFARLRNGELAFAHDHLGVSKSVFLHAATIGHMNLEELGDDEALAQIRDQIMSLVDSSQDNRSAAMALRHLEGCIARIGPAGAHLDKPLPAAQIRLEQLADEFRETVARRQELDKLDAAHVAALDEADSLRSRRIALEEELTNIERVDRANRLRRAGQLTAQHEELTQRCFALSRVHEFPLDRWPEVQHVVRAVSDAREQLERTRSEHAELRQQLDTELERLGSAGEHRVKDIPEHTERKLAELERSLGRVRDRLDGIDAEIDAAEADHLEAKEALDTAPDFSRQNPDPVEWLSGLATSFQVQVRSRNNEQDRLERLREQTEAKAEEVAKPEQVFSRFEDFGSAVRDYEVQVRVFDDQQAAIDSRTQELRDVAEEHASAVPGSRWMVLLGSVLGAMFAGFAYFWTVTFVYIPAALCGVVVLLFLANWAWASRAIRSTDARLVRAQFDKTDLEQTHTDQRDAIESALEEARCETLRELEALYEEFCKDRSELESLQEQLSQREAQCAGEEDQARKLFEELTATFDELDVDVADEDDVQAAAGRAIGRYQEYREFKSRVDRTRDVPGRLRGERDRRTEELESLEEEEAALSLEVREIMREAGFHGEAEYDQVGDAVRAYRTHCAQIREKQSRAEMLREQAEQVEGRMGHEEDALRTHEEKLAELLDAGKAESVEQWHELAGQAKEYRKIRNDRTRIQEELQTILDEDDLEALRRAVAADGPVRMFSGRDPAEVRADQDALVEALEEKTREAHALKLTIMERRASLRDLNVVEEELSEMAQRAEHLQHEVDAAAYAAALIEETARERHKRLTPALASQASRFLSDVTRGAYSQLEINDDLHIRVHVPAADGTGVEFERSLSKGTVDQVYLALRLALVHSVSATSETIPMLLDDPFANYDDDRLANGLELLTRLAGSSQILLFTCRQDVANAAKAVGAPILSL